MSELSHYYREVACNSSTWSSPDSRLCGCGGGGWWNSEVDTWHECPHHYEGQPHPEYGAPDEDEVEALEPGTDFLREQYRTSLGIYKGEMTDGEGTSRGFREACEARLKKQGITDPTPAQWERAARELVAPFVEDDAIYSS